MVLPEEPHVDARARLWRQSFARHPSCVCAFENSVRDFRDVLCLTYSWSYPRNRQRAVAAWEDAGAHLGVRVADDRRLYTDTSSRTLRLRSRERGALHGSPLQEMFMFSIKPRWLWLVLVAGAIGLTRVSYSAQELPHTAGSVALPVGFTERTENVNGVTIHYKIGGQGPVVVLLHGYTQTSHMWLPLMPQLSASHTVIAPDLRGAGQSERTAGGYDRKTLATDVRNLVRQLGYTEPVQVVGHDIGLMVAYAYAAQYPNEVGQVVLMDAFLPGIGSWEDVWLLRDLWHFHFYGDTPEALVKGRERIYFEHFWNDFAADETRSVPEADRQLYAAAYARDNGIRAGFEYFKSFEQDAKDFAAFSAAKLSMPVLILTGEKASGEFLIEQGRLVASDVRGSVIKGSGHWLMEEAPQQVIPALVHFINEPATSSATVQNASHRQRLTALEANALGKATSAAGTSRVSGIVTSILKGAPTKPGVYTILLQVPANTRIEAHAHPDDRVATVVSGTWYFGYGHKFAEQQLKALPPGSFYTEPPNERHFARTGETAVVLQITGFGPTGTRYAEGTATPRAELPAKK